MKNKQDLWQEKTTFYELLHTLLYVYRVPMHNDKGVIEELHEKARAL